jgi:ComF family protein
MCEACLRKPPHFDALGASHIYDGPLKEAVSMLKYGRKVYVADALGSFMAIFAETWLDKTEDIVVTPVPLHPKRLQERGFNQSLFMARHVASRLNLEIDFLALRRIKNTASQTGLSRKNRHKNVKDAFQVISPNIFKDRTALLVDDVATTGNTLNEGARVLKMAGAAKVLGLVLARADKK